VPEVAETLGIARLFGLSCVTLRAEKMSDDAKFILGFG
jgi:hypothetical protein